MAEKNLKRNKEGYGYKYTDLAQIHEYLEQNNMQYIQKVERIENDDYIYTKRFIEGKWEEDWLQGCRVVQAILQGKKQPGTRTRKRFDLCKTLFTFNGFWTSNRRRRRTKFKQTPKQLQRL